MEGEIIIHVEIPREKGGRGEERRGDKWKFFKKQREEGEIIIHVEIPRERGRGEKRRGHK